MESQSRSEATELRRFFSNPLVGLVGSLASIAGVGLAFYFYSASRSAPGLTYMVHPVKAVVVRSGQTPRLSVMLDGKPIEGDVTAVQVALWNGGRAPIRANHILQPFNLRTVPCVPLVDATIRKQSRDVVAFALRKDGMPEGELGVSWNILEHRDGAVIQLVFAGDVRTDVLIDGVNEGQPEVHRVAERFARRDRAQSVESFPASLAWLYIAMGAFATVYGSLRFRRRLALGRARALVATLPIMGVVMIGMGVVLLVFFGSSGPPFGF